MTPPVGVIDAPLGLYLHVPFCGTICAYCNFNRGLYEESLKTRYVTAVVREIERCEVGENADTIYFGGGTPSLLTPIEVGRMIDTCRRVFQMSDVSEVTLEINPEDAVPERLDGYREVGVNRLSFGVQSFSDEELCRLGRNHSADQAREAVIQARRSGFNNVSIDLMLWLPQQTVTQTRESVDALLALRTEHASLYLLELYPNAPLREIMARQAWSLAPDDDAVEMYLNAFDQLEAAGYKRYELSNAALPGCQSRHNLKYWSDGEWLGFGCGAHSTRRGKRWHNISSTADYVDLIESGGDPVAGYRVLNVDQRVEEALFTGLHLTEGVDLKSIRQQYGVDVWKRYGEDLSSHLQAGLVSWDINRLRLTRRGTLLANEVMGVFV